MALLTSQVINQAGIVPVFVAATAGGDTCQPDARGYLHFKNASGGSITVTLAVAPQLTPAGDAYPPHAVAVAAGSERQVGPLDPTIYARPSDGLVGITYSGVTSLTVGFFRS